MFKLMFFPGLNRKSFFLARWQTC